MFVSLTLVNGVVYLEKKVHNAIRIFNILKNILILELIKCFGKMVDLLDL
jgi:hypothetical protein